MLEARRHMLNEKILKTWCSLVRFGVHILISLYPEKLIYFYIKNNYYSNWFAMRLVITPEIILKTCDNGCVLVYIFIAF